MTNSESLVARLRWPSGPVCPACQGTQISRIRTRPLYYCRTCRRQFTAKTGTLLEDSPLTENQWLRGLHAVYANPRLTGPILQRLIKVSPRTANRLMKTLRAALAQIPPGLSFEETLRGFFKLKKKSIHFF